MISGTRCVVVALVVLAVLAGLYWWMLGDYRDTKVELARLTAKMAVIEKNQRETERIIKALDRLKIEVEDAREETNAQLQDSYDLTGDERLDYLKRLLKEDRDRRNGGSAAGALAGAVQ